MKKVVLATLVGCFVCFSYGSASDGVDGNKLLKICSDAIALVQNNGNPTDPLNGNNQSFNMGECMGYLQAAADLNLNVAIVNYVNSKTTKNYYCLTTKPMGYENFKSKLFMPFPQSCAPSNVTYLQTAKIIVKYLGDHPEKLNDNALDIITTATKEVFPCDN